MNPLKQLETCGQSIWLDYLKRSITTSGELQTLIARDGLKGMTSNPAIFEKAIGHSGEYVQSIEEFLNEGDRSISEVYEHLAIPDIQAAADILRPVFEQTEGRDGYVSLECSPYIADDTAATVAEALRLRELVNRPNLMVKVPGTPAGLPAIRKLLGQGLSINITLLFAVSVYEQVAEAYIAGLEEYAANGGDVSKVASVASFFVSRIDTAVDKKLDGLGSEEITEPLRNVIAIANAKIAYTRYKQIFSGARWQKLAKQGARTQRLLWASTSTKSPKLRDTMYVEELIGRDTVNTIPPATMDAYRDHGEGRCDSIEQDLDKAQKQLMELPRREVSLAKITDELVVDGVKQFADAFDKLLSAVAKRRRLKLEGEEPIQKISAGSAQFQSSIDAELENWRIKGNVRRLWRGDKSLWTSKDEDKWLGWLDAVKRGLTHIGELEDFAANVRKNYSHVVLLGMGGSSLGPEVLGLSFGPQAGWPHLCVLDSTDPAQIAAVDNKIDIRKTLFIVSSKSGSTLEPNIFLDYFYDRVTKAIGAADAGRQFVAITDPGSSLERTAGKLGFAHTFPGVPSIGGRYSVLSNFGLVPAAVAGIDIKKLLESAAQMVRSCGDDVPPACNPGVELGIAWGVAAKTAGRDKITIVASPRIASFGGWLEQLIAESTGKLGRGLIPLAEEPLADPSRYGSDRFFVHLILDKDESPAQSQALAALEAAGHPVARIHVKDIYHIGQEFFRFEIATAAAGAVIGINPFDQPDVEDAKIAARQLTDAYEKSHKLPEETPIFEKDGISLYADQDNAKALGKQDSLAAYMKAHFGRVKAGDYVALLAYLERNEAHTKTLQALRVKLRDKTKAATCLGFGPRFQHSTGQAYKGGPNTGVFLQITCDDAKDLAVPTHSYTFGIVKAAQAAGDLKVLDDRHRRALRIHLHDPAKGLEALTQAIA